ncbi:atzF [Symbiodinium sp. KB8]|nr:atzF [Symbiodinium sp. KB8]
MRALQRAAEASMEAAKAQVLVTPTVGATYKIEDVLADPIALNTNLGRFTNHMNLLDLCGLAVPTAWASDALPFGVTISAQAGSDAYICDIGQRLHASSGLPVGALEAAVEDVEAAVAAKSGSFYGPLPSGVDTFEVAVCGAHMAGLPLSPQLTERGGRFMRAARTSPRYRLVAFDEMKPPRRVTVDADLNEEVGTLKRRAQIALGVGRGRLVGSSRSVLDASSPIKRVRLQNGDLLTVHINRVQVQACRPSFAAILGDGSVVTWGGAAFGGDHSAVQDQLKNVQQIQASDAAFAAILGDGSVVTWGSAAFGGDSSDVQDQLKNVQQIQASSQAFAAILGDGSVVTWGSAAYGGDSRAVQDQLKNVQQIQASSKAFAAILADGSVVTWGADAYGGDSSTVRCQLKNVQQIQASDSAFAAVLGDGSVVTWVLPLVVTVALCTIFCNLSRRSHGV